MKLYKSKKSFFVSEINDYIQKDALVYRFENVYKISVHNSAISEDDGFTADDARARDYTEPSDVEWFLRLELNTEFFEFIKDIDETQTGTEATASETLPAESEFLQPIDGVDKEFDDGLFPFEVGNTRISESVNDINVVLKSLVPSEAPNLSFINSEDVGIRATLAFDENQPIDSYAPVMSFNDLIAKNRNDIYEPSLEGGDIVLGVFDGNTDINGVISPNNSTNGFPDNSFSNGTEGNISLYLNGVKIIDVDLTSTNDAIVGTYGVEGTNLSISSATIDSFNQAGRTGTWNIDSASQRDGWNYVQIMHVVDAQTIYSSNLISWIKETDVTPITAVGAYSNLNLTGSEFLTGVEYYNDGTVDYTADISNAYKNVFNSDDNVVTFNGDAQIASKSLPPLTGSQNANQVANFPCTNVQIIPKKLFGGSISSSVNCSSLFGSGMTNDGVAIIDDILLYEVNQFTSPYNEEFQNETHRLELNNFDNQADVANNSFNSATNRSGGGSLFVYGEELVAVPRLGNGGNFNLFANAPASNADYTGVTGNLIYNRKITNETGNTVFGFQLEIDGEAELADSVAELGANNKIFVEIKVPSRTGWGVLTPLANSNIQDGDGILTNFPQSQNLPLDEDVTFGNNFILNNESAVIRITADAQWTGRITGMRFTM